MEAVGRFLLVRPQHPAVLHQADVVRLAVDVTREVLGRPPDLEQQLLDVASLGRVDDDRVFVDASTEQRLDLLGPQHFFEDGPVG